MKHDDLTQIYKRLPEDYEPYGLAPRDYGDCSSGCRFFVPLEGKLGMDWGICANPSSHRCGLLTFEHQGCKHIEIDYFEYPPDGQMELNGDWADD